MSIRTTNQPTQSLSVMREKAPTAPMRKASPVARFALASAALLLVAACTDVAPPPDGTPATAVPPARATTPPAPETSDSVDETLDALQVSRADEECCTDPGSIALCWWQDAENDGATCQSDTDCGPKNCNKDIRLSDGRVPPNNWGLCECSSDDDCDSGICTEIDGNAVCGPSYCNGYLNCSCFGGCDEANYGSFDSPTELCEDASGACCEGQYPSSPDGNGIGHCAVSCDGSIIGRDCTLDSECTDPIPDPYSSDCAQYVCDRGKCTIDYIDSGDECAANVQVTDITFWGTESRSAGNLSCFVGRCNSSGRCLSDPGPAEGLPCDEDDGNACTGEICVSGVCDHDPTLTIGDNCNQDDDACTLDECDGTGTCVVGPPKECNDNNFCTSPDTCEDNDPDHIAPTCDNPPVDGNAEGFGYTDTEDCSDLICVGGVEVPTAVSCAGYNPDSLDLQCNTYTCVDGNGEDNCTLSYLSQVGDTCSDADGCTIGDRCIDGGSSGVCSPTGNLDCSDMNECTDDICSGGTCSNPPKTGAGCDDGNPCTLSDTCGASGSCIPGSLRDCSAFDNQCTNGVCNTGTGTCEADFLAAGTACDADGDPCTLNDACDGAGSCVAGGTKDCSSEDDTCNVGVCNSVSGLCEKDPVPKEGASCNADNDLCTVSDTCQSGVCTADTNTVTCSGNDQCNVRLCEPSSGNCVYQNSAMLNVTCDGDSNGCTVETCQGGDASSPLTCTASGTVDCDDGNACTAGSCVSTGSFTHTCDNSPLPDTTACDADGDGCTKDDHCNGTGGCVSGTAVTPVACETEILAAEPTFDLDCNTAECISGDSITYQCVPVPLSVPAGSCAADAFGCTLDTCAGDDPVLGATCVVGADRDCSASDNLPCLIGDCVEGGDAYSSSCGTTNAAAGVSCDADGDGCTVDDACDGAGACAPGSAAVCTPSGPCLLSECNSSDADTYTCVETTDTACCVVDADCEGQGFSCNVGDVCSALTCNGGVCECAVAPVGTDCATEIDIAAYPENCYEATCNASADCAAALIDLADVDNNLCSDLFDGSGAAFDGTKTGYLGSLAQSDAAGTQLTATGSTLCTENNYQASSTHNCSESGGGDLGANGPDAVYGFEFETQPSTARTEYAYLVKVEADFDAAVYVQSEISGASACMEGNNPTQDDPSGCVSMTGTGSISYKRWTGISGSTVADIPLGTTPASSGTLTSLETASLGDDYGQQIVGYLTAPTTGSYTFWIASDDDSQLWLSTDDTAANKVLLASVSGWTGSNEWTKFSSQKSSAVSLTAGNRYYIEVLHKEGWGGDQLQVGWAKPGEGTSGPSEIVPGAQLSPEGSSAPSASCIQTLDWTCSYPYSAVPMPDVAEETCAAGNGLAGQECCDPCDAGGGTCGYNWCERGYDTAGTSCSLCGGSCDDIWEYPEGPFDCTANVPTGASFSGFTHMATTVIVPSDKDDSWKNAVIYVDGSGGAEGNFYLTVEKIPWVSSPCERVDDDARIRDATSVGSGKTYYDTVDNLANSNHSYSTTTCGGYDCTPVWSGDNSCHDTSVSANPFWPAESFYSIYRESSSATYCVTVSNPSSNALDAVLTRYEAPGASDICYEPYPNVYCERNNYQGDQERMEFTAAAGTQYLIGVSRYEGLNRPCFNSSGDDCDFDIEIIEGACPSACINLSDWYTGYVGSAAVTVNGSTFPTTYTDATVGTIYRHLISGNTSGAGRANDFDLGAGWDGNDEVHQLDFTGGSDATVYFSGCDYDGSGSYDGRMALYDCQGNLLTSNDDGCGMNGMAAFSYTMTASESPYYLVVDGDGATDNGAFDIAVYYAPTCSDGLQNGTETGVDCGGSCPACAPTCSDGIQNGTETGVDCGGSCPACGCGAGRCMDDGDCDPSTPYCDLDPDVLDGDGCGACRTHFVQCNPGANTFVDMDAAAGAMLSGIPLNGGCINMVMGDNENEWNMTANDHRAMKLQNTGTPAAGSCNPTSTPYLLHWNATYCKVYEESDGTRHDPTVGWGTNWLDYSVTPNVRFWYPENCVEVGKMYGTQVVNSWWDEIRIPVRRYTLNMEIYFENSTSCAMDFYVYYDWADWGPYDTSLVCSDSHNMDPSWFSANPVSCDPTPPY